MYLNRSGSVIDRVAMADRHVNQQGKFGKVFSGEMASARQSPCVDPHSLDSSICGFEGSQLLPNGPKRILELRVLTVEQN